MLQSLNLIIFIAFALLLKQFKQKFICFTLVEFIHVHFLYASSRHICWEN